MSKPKGTLISIGGNEDKGLNVDETHSLDFIEDGILSKVVELGGGHLAKIKVITSASSIPIEVGENYLAAFQKLDCKNIEILNISSAEQADAAANISAVTEADIVMFSGGDQRRLSQFFIGSQFLSILKDRYQNEDFIIAGTSAGAVAMSETMVSGGSAEYAMKKGEVKIMEGLGFMKDVIFDSHFIKRGRFGRMAEAVARHPQLLGIGLGEDTGVIITEGDQFETIGSGMVILFDGSDFVHNNVNILKEGTPITLANLKVHVLANYDKYDLHRKKITAQPLIADRID